MGRGWGGVSKSGQGSVTASRSSPYRSHTGLSILAASSRAPLLSTRASLSFVLVNLCVRVIVTVTQSSSSIISPRCSPPLLLHLLLLAFLLFFLLFLSIPPSFSFALSLRPVLFFPQPHRCRSRSRSRSRSPSSSPSLLSAHSLSSLLSGHSLSLLSLSHSLPWWVL